MRKNRFLAVALALTSVLVGAGCPDVGGVTGKKEDPVSLAGTWSGTLAATFTDNTSASINLTYWIAPSFGGDMSAYGVDNVYSAQLITQRTTDTDLTVTINPPDISADAFGSSTLTVNYAIRSTTLTPTSASGQFPVGDRANGLAVLKTVKSVSGALSRTFTNCCEQSRSHVTIMAGTVKYFDKFMYGVEGATVSSSLDARTTIADKNGYFFLVANSPPWITSNIVPYAVTFTRSGFRTSGFKALFGGQKTNATFEIKKGVGSVFYDKSKIYVEGNVYVGVPGGVGAPIAGAVVRTTADGTTAVTDATGWFFLLTGVADIGHSGIYNLTIDAPGFARWNYPLDGRDTYSLSRLP